MSKLSSKFHNFLEWTADCNELQTLFMNRKDACLWLILWLLHALDFISQ